jgi:hypothetical protein
MSVTKKASDRTQHFMFLFQYKLKVNNFTTIWEPSNLKIWRYILCKPEKDYFNNYFVSITVTNKEFDEFTNSIISSPVYAMQTIMNYISYTLYKQVHQTYIDIQLLAMQ